MKGLGSITKWSGALVALAASVPAHAVGVDIDTGGSGVFEGITALMQDIIDFLSGPWAVFALVSALIIAVCAWIWAPKDGLLGGVLRVAAGGAIILNSAGWVLYLQGFST